MLTAQEVFDRVATHLLTQRRKSEDNDLCLYRGPDGLKCAFGCLIPDDKYDLKMEGKIVNDPELQTLEQRIAEGAHLSEEEQDRMAITRKLNQIALSYGEHLKLMQCLQRLHDNQPAIYWRFELIILSGKFGLSHKVVSDFAPDQFVWEDLIAQSSSKSSSSISPSISSDDSVG